MQIFTLNQWTEAGDPYIQIRKEKLEEAVEEGNPIGRPPVSTIQTTEISQTLIHQSGSIHELVCGP